MIKRQPAALTETDLSVVVHMPGDQRKSLRHLTKADLDAIAANMDRAEAKDYFELARLMNDTETFQEALKAGKFPNARYVPPVVPLFQEPNQPPRGAA